MNPKCYKSVIPAPNLVGKAYDGIKEAQTSMAC
jgi:hypothetical protein